MSFEEIPSNTPRPESAGAIENTDLSTDIEAEMFTLQEEAEKLKQEVEILQAEGVDENIDEKKKNDIFTQTRKIIYAIAALAAIPMVSSVLKPEKAKEINEVMSKLVNNNIPEVLTALGVMVAAGTIYVVRLEIEDSKNRSLCQKMFKSMIEKTETNNWSDLDVDLDNFKEKLMSGVFMSRKSEKKDFGEQLSAIKEKLELQPELVKDGTLLKLNNLISSLNY